MFLLFTLPLPTGYIYKQTEEAIGGARKRSDENKKQLIKKEKSERASCHDVLIQNGKRKITSDSCRAYLIKTFG